MDFHDQVHTSSVDESINQCYLHLCKVLVVSSNYLQPLWGKKQAV